jgi:ribonuclease Z
MELWFLGTSAGRPILERNVTSIVLQMPPARGTIWMVDCGEGTQHQLLRTPLKLSKLEKLFITHLHGDHVFGLPGLLSTRSSIGATEPVELYGPLGLKEMLDTAFRVTGTHLGYELTVHEIGDDAGIVLDDDRFIVKAAKLDHRIDCFGYRIVEKANLGSLNAELLAEMGVPSGPVYGQLKRGEDVTLPDGRTIHARDVVGDPLPGRIITILGDTRPCRNAVELAREADVLVHEATFNEALSVKAAEYGHSTTVQAAETAREAEVQRLFLTHFSTRFVGTDLPLLEQEARDIFPSADAAVELKSYPIHSKKKQS